MKKGDNFYKKPAALFIGRWQPFHNGHDYIIKQALDAGKNVLIAVRMTETDEKNPYEANDVVEMIQIRFDTIQYRDRVKVIQIPDIESVNIGRKVGYDVNRYDVPPEIEGISATKIRECIDKKDDSWRNMVPKRVANYLEDIEQDEQSSKGTVFWLTGVCAVGKSTIAQSIRKACYYKPTILDGDILRKGISKGLGLSMEDRQEHIRRAAHTAKLLIDTGTNVLVPVIAPLQSMREMAENIIGPSHVKWVYLYCDKEVCIERDPKGLYAKAIAGEISGLTGYDGIYEVPEDPWMRFDTGKTSVEEITDEIVYRVEKCY